MPRITICVDVNTPQQAVVDAWLERWRDRLDFCSDNEGCGCCVDIYRVECSPEAIADLPNPHDVTCMDAWSGFPGT